MWPATPSPHGSVTTRAMQRALHRLELHRLSQRRSAGSNPATRVETATLTLRRGGASVQTRQGSGVCGGPAHVHEPISARDCVLRAVNCARAPKSYDASSIVATARVQRGPSNSRRRGRRALEHVRHCNARSCVWPTCFPHRAHRRATVTVRRWTASTIGTRTNIAASV